MPIIAIKVSKLTLPQKIEKGQVIINKSTENPDVPGNATVLSGFSAAQDALNTANTTEMEARVALAELMEARITAEEDWMTKLNLLASFTESATGGEAGSIIGVGFAVRNRRTPPQYLPAPINVEAVTNGTPGHTQLTWAVVAGAKSYVIQISPDPITPTSWQQSCICTAANADVNGAEAGKCYWYRVAAVNAKGQGPWSDPASRPVM